MNLISKNYSQRLNITRIKGVGNPFPVHRWLLLSLDKAEFNGKLSVAFLYILYDVSASPRNNFLNIFN